MSVSPSQCVNCEDCPRRWWFEKVAKIRLPDSKPQHFGHALHLLCGCALSSAEIPPTWAEHLSNDEVELCLSLRDRALKKGVLRPRAGIVEADFHMPVGEREMHGVIDFLDLDTPGKIVIEDHKAIKSLAWARKSDDLRNDIPMMVYAGYAFTQSPKEIVVLRHNQFVTENGETVDTEVEVTKDEVRRFWGRRVMPILKTMDATRMIETWDLVQGRDRLSDACTKYGGCAYVAICHKGMPIEQFQGTSSDKNGAPF